MCLTGKVEDETHVLLHCYVYQRYRETMFQDIKRLTNFDCLIMEDDPSWILQTVLGDGLSREKDRRVVYKCVGNFLSKTMNIRKEWLCTS